MGKIFIKGPVKLGIVMELDNAPSDTTDFQYPRGTTVTYGVDNIGAHAGFGSLCDTTNLTYALITEKGSVSIDSFGQEFDTYDTLENYYSHDIDIREIGGGSCEFVTSYIGTQASGDPASIMYLQYASAFLPNGFTTNDIDGSTQAGYAPEEDTAITKLTDHRGYAIIVEQEVSSTVFLQWIFHNAKIDFTSTFGSKKATRGSLKWSDARYIQYKKVAAAANLAGTGADHSDA